MTRSSSLTRSALITFSIFSLWFLFKYSWKCNSLTFSILNSSLENKTYSIQCKKQEISLLRWDLCPYIRVLWNLKTCQECISPSGIFSRYILHHVIAETYRAIKLKARWNLYVKRKRNNICFNRKSRFQILLRILVRYSLKTPFRDIVIYTPAESIYYYPYSI